MTSYILLEGGTDKLLEEDGSSVLVLEDHTAASGATGAITWAEGNDSWAGAGAETFSGTFSWAESGDTWAAAGAERISGTLSWTEGNDTWTAAGGGILAGTITWAEGNDTWFMTERTAESVNSTTWRGPLLKSSTWKSTRGT